MKIKSRDKKKLRIRNKLKKFAGNDRLRLSISRSAKNISAQLIDDKNNKTVVSATSNEKSIKNLNKKKLELSAIVAEKIANKAKEKNIKKIYFDRGIFKYHGRVKVFAETLRKNGMDF